MRTVPNQLARYPLDFTKAGLITEGRKSVFRSIRVSTTLKHAFALINEPDSIEQSMRSLRPINADYTAIVQDQALKNKSVQIAGILARLLLYVSQSTQSLDLILNNAHKRQAEAVS